MMMRFRLQYEIVLTIIKDPNQTIFI